MPKLGRSAGPFTHRDQQLAKKADMAAANT